MPEHVKNIAVIGAGLVGAGWAIVFARAGHHVKIYDSSETLLQSLNTQICDSLNELEKYGLINERSGAISARLTVANSLKEALTDADYIQESVLEQLPIKKSVSAEISRGMPPHAVVGSSTSGFPGSSFTADLPNRSQFLVVHPVNPPHIVPVVEIVPTPWTDPAIVTWVRQFMEQVGQVPVVVNKEIDGFILNRLQGALLDEAWRLFDEGYASAADIDATISHGLGLRWAFMGPFETIDLNAPQGIDDYARRFAEMYQRLASLRHPGPKWPDDVVARATDERRSLLPSGQLAQRRRWRDGELMAMIAFKRSRKNG